MNFSLDLKIIIIELILFSLFLIPTLIAITKGAPWVPTPMNRVRKMLELAKIKEGEKIYDLGCGDGRFVHLASKKYKAEAVGFELSPLVYLIAKIFQPFWRSKAKIKFKNFHKVDLSDADIIVCYLLPNTLKALQEKFEKELKKGARIISYAFQIKDWKEIKKVEKIPKKRLSTIWVYER